MPALLWSTAAWLIGAALGAVTIDAAIPGAPVRAWWLLGIGVGVVGGLVGARRIGWGTRETRFPVALTVTSVLLGVMSLLRTRDAHAERVRCEGLLREALATHAPIALVLEPPPLDARSGQQRALAWLFEHGRTPGHTGRRCRVPTLVRRALVSSWQVGTWYAVVASGVAIGARARIEQLTVQSIPPSLPRTDWARALRGRAARVIDRDFGADAPIVRALLIADQRDISVSVRDTFADAGLVHVLSISGLHVTVIASALLVLGSAARLPFTAAGSAAMLLVALYVGALGVPPPAARSAVMFAVTTISRMAQRPTHVWAPLALGAVVPVLWSPLAVIDLGWQLSVSGMASLVASQQLLRRLVAIEDFSMPDTRTEARTPARSRARARRATWKTWLRSLGGWRRTLVHECVAGVMATVLTAPLVAWSFGRVALVAIVSNLAAAPLVTLLQPTLFLSVLLSPFPLLSGTVARVAAMPLALLTHVATLFGQLPFAVWRVAPTRVTAVAAALAMMLVVVAIARRRWKPPAAGAAVVALCALWWPVIAPAPKHLEVHMLDVGQGDALALRTPRGQWIIIDAGKVWEGGDDGRRVVIPYLRARGGRVAMFVLSHAHADHVGGAAAIVSALSPQRWVEPAYVFPGRGYLDALEAVHERHVVYRRATPGDRWVIDNVALTVLAPDSGWTAAQHDANETSVVLRVDYGARSFLFTGDAEAGEEAWLLRHAPKGALDVDVLKVGHHGSRTSSTDPFLDAVTPVAALVSVGAGNRYRHPAPETLDRLLARRVPVLRTDADGTVVLGTDGATLWLELGGERHTLVHGGRDLAAPPP